MSFQLNKSEVVWTLGLVGAVATYLSTHGLSFDAPTIAAVAGILFAYLKSSPFKS